MKLGEERRTLCFHSYMEYVLKIKNKIAEQTKPNTHIDTEDRVMVTSVAGWWREREMDEGSQLYGDGWKLKLLIMSMLMSV